MSANVTAPQIYPVDYATWAWASAWSYIIIAIITIGLISITVYHFWEEHRYPLESKRIKQAKIKGKPGIILGGDDGYADYVCSDEFIHEGVLESKPIGGKKGEPWVGFLPREDDLESLVVAEGKDKEKTAAVIKWLGHMASRRLTWRDAKTPIWFAYRGKTILISLFGIVAMEFLNTMSAQLPDLFVAVDLLAVKTWFDMPWDQTQRSAQGQRRENVGFKKGKKWNSQEGLKQILGYIIVAIAFGCILIALTYVVTH
jgi:hypothetical protein